MTEERRKDYPEIKERLARIEERQISAERAVCVATEAMQKRLEGMNEFRETLKDQAGRFVTREELDLKLNRILEDIRELREHKSKMEGKADQSAVNRVLVISVMGLIISLLSIGTNLIK